MRKFLVTTAIALTAAAAPAYAQTPTVIFTPGVFSIPVGFQAAIFQNFEGGPGNNTAFNAAADPQAVDSVSGAVLSQSGSIPGESVDPDGIPGNRYISIGDINPTASGTYTVTLPQTSQFFSFILGSLDTYNRVTLNFANGNSLALFGSQIITGSLVPPAANGTGPFNADGSSNVSGRVSYDLGLQSGITSVSFFSTQAALEIDDLASAVPEPATWGMMMLGFGLIGSQLRSRRRRQVTLATA